MSDLLVSCILLTTAKRRAMAEEAIACYHAQTYPNTELVIQDDEDQMIGWKRQRAIEKAKGKIIAHWDDDDWSHPDRLRLQVQALLEAERAQVCGLNSMPFLDVRTGRCVMYVGGPQYIIGTSLVYFAGAAHRHPFLNKQIGEDNAWLRHFEGPARVAMSPETPLMVARWHNHSTVDKYGIFHDPRGRFRDVTLQHEVPLCPFG